MTRDRARLLPEAGAKLLESVDQAAFGCRRCGPPPLRNAIEVGPEDVLTEQDVELLGRVKKGILPCPWCDLPLRGEFVYYELRGDDDYTGVRLSCVCGFLEY